MAESLKQVLHPRELVKTLLSGFIMGVANIIPGISGGTIIFALGLYPKFIGAIADLTRFRFSPSSIVFLILLFGMSLVSVALFSTAITMGLELFHHFLFALFIGLTLGGVPLLWRELRPISPQAIAACLFGLALMVTLALMDRSAVPQNFVVFLGVGLIASSAMVLPGISGSYLLLLLGMYYPVVSAIKEFVAAGRAMDLGTAFGIGANILLPVGIGVVVGIVVLANFLKFALESYKQPTLGFLLGLLMGSVVGIWPFGELRDKDEIIASAHPMNSGNLVFVITFVVIGFMATIAVGNLGAGRKNSAPAS